MNKIFKLSESKLYGNGEIIHLEKNVFVTEYKCMDYLMPEDVFDACLKQLS
ncbi:MAG: hypothetical protein M3R36_05115 [Bacteroidota bacterium]|nr:hypothetical protein [Bacteroidota bacterium]